MIVGVRFKDALLGLCLAVSLSAVSCSPQAQAGPHESAMVPDKNSSADEPAFPAPNERADDTRFEDVLAQYQGLNRRLEAVTAPLVRDNAQLCSRRLRDAGYTVHSVTDYPENLQAVARRLLQVDDALSVRTVRSGSTADKAGLRAGDRIIGIDGQRIVAGLTQQKFYDQLTRGAFSKTRVKITIARGDAVMTKTLSPQTICGYPVNVFFDERVNGHTDGDAVWITSELMRTVPDDVNLSLIIAHEMAHAMAGHMQQTPHKDLELMADRMALIMMARAGLDIDRALAYWDEAAHPHYTLQENSLTHPSITERRDNLAEAVARIKKAQAAGLDLDFSVID